MSWQPWYGNCVPLGPAQPPSRGHHWKALQAGMSWQEAQQARGESCMLAHGAATSSTPSRGSTS